MLDTPAGPTEFQLFSDAIPIQPRIPMTRQLNSLFPGRFRRPTRPRAAHSAGIAAILIIAAFTSTPTPAHAQATTAQLDGLRPRNIGPAVMSGRIVDLAVAEADPIKFYVASATGGVFKTGDNGITLTAVFENEGTHSVGAIALHQRDTSIVWVGTGERANRQSSSWGDGVYKSTDGGATWTNMGLRDSKHIGRIALHPDDTELVYVAAMGHLWGPNEERGLYRSRDGGMTWQPILQVDEHTGAVDVALDPSDPNIVYAAELARVSVWIGEIQWMRRNGFPGSREPILDPLETIECRDAILTPEGGEPDWPDTDVIIGNPPFLGGKLLISNLGEEYISTLFRLYDGRVPREADLVCYWFVKAGARTVETTRRVGLVATNSIRGGANRRALEQATGGKVIFDAWSDEPWVIDGAAVRVSLVCFSAEDDGVAADRRLDGETVDEVYTDLTARRGESGLDLTKARRLARNAGVAFMGDTKGGPFDVSGDLAREWLREPSNPNGRPNSDVLKPWMNGMAITRRSADKWIIDFGWEMLEGEAALYESPFQYAREHVHPMRQRNRRKAYRLNWWRHVEPRQGMWRALDGLARYIVTPTVAKHRLFAWLDARVCPDHQLIVVAREDDTAFGILHSRFHEAWSLRKGTSLEDRPRYTPTTTFETFPFPDGLSPDIPASDYKADPRAEAIASAARRLVELRDRWLNPPEWVEWIEEPVRGHPPRPVPCDKKAATALKKRTLTNLYNARPQWLADAHAQLDAAVAAAYGWPGDISDDAALRELLARNRR